MDEEDEFSTGIILPPLIIQLKKILEQYPDDSQILKVRQVTFSFSKTHILSHPF